MCRKPIILVLVMALGTLCHGAANLIINGEFDEGLDPWGVSAGDGYTVQVVQGAGLSDPNAMFIDITDATAQDYIMVAQGDLTFEAGEVYPIGFMARAEADRQMRIVLQQLDTWIDLWQGMVSLTTEAKTYTFEYTHSQGQMGDVAFYFILRNPWFPVPGEDENIGVYIDSVHVGELPRANPDIAYDPTPADGTKGVVNPVLQWEPGDTAVSHRVYVGTSPTLTEADFAAEAGWPVHYYIGGFVPGTTYYWRVDEKEADGTIHTGDVWSFTAAPLEASAPQPPDGAKWLDPSAVLLTWQAGAKADSHDVYFGTDRTAVADGTGDTLKANQWETSFDPGTLAQETTYYWRIDELETDGVTKYPGDVWSFTTVGPGGGIKGYYFNNMDVSGSAAMSRVDEVIDFSWGEGSPDPSIDFDQFSVRWVGELEVAFTEAYTFYTISDDGVRLWVNDEQIIGAWFDQGTTEHKSEPIELVAGQRYPITMEYYENTGGAVCRLLWSSPSTSKEIIPRGALSPPLRASSPKPADGAIEVKETPSLTWTPGDKAAQHDVYFGSDPTAVADADTTAGGIYRGRRASTKYVPTEAPLEWDKTYYWRIDEVNGVDMWTGNVWSFTTANFIVIDDFEDYNDYPPDRIFQTWIDGYGYTEPAPGKEGNGTGSTVGYLSAPFAEQTIVHGGGQSMPFGYDNTGAGGKTRYSEAEREFPVAQDFTRNGVKALTLYVYGDPCNAPMQLYVGLQDSTGTRVDVPETNTNLVLMNSWQEINIELSEFSPVNPASITKIYFGAGSRLGPAVGGTGMLFVDDIRLHAPRCVASIVKPANDLNDDCVVDYLDLDIVANEWLTSGLLVTPVDPGTSGLVAYYTLDGNTNDSAGGHHGTPNGGPTYVPGQVGQAIRLDGVDDYVVVSSVGISGSDARTIALWAKANSTAIPDWTNVCGFSGPSANGQHFDLQIVGDTPTTTSGWFGLHAHGWEQDILPNDLDWHHLAASHDGTTARWYGDGRLVGSGVVDINSPGSVHMGKREDNDNYFAGSVDEARIFNRVLSDGEIASLAGLTSPFSEPYDLNVDSTVDFLDVVILGDAWLNERLWP